MGGKLDGFAPVAVAEQDDRTVALLAERKGGFCADPFLGARSETPSDFFVGRSVQFEPRLANDLSHFEAAFPEHETIELPNANHFFFEDELETMLAKSRAFVPTP
jgi:hypothetical protein